MNRKNYVGQRFGKLIVKEMLYRYKNKYTYARCKCDCGKETIAFIGNIVSGKTKSCGCYEKESRYNRQNHEKDLSNKKFGNLLALHKTDKKYSNGCIGWLCKCDCGNTVIVKSSNLICGKTKSCGCNKRSQYEELIEEYLQSNHITFKTEYRFKDCRNHFPLPFDFYIENHNGNRYCIEYQGEHHYEPISGWGGIEKFKTVQKNDEIKSQYCKDNNIILVCLPYTLSKQAIIKTLDNILEPVTTTVV